MKKTEFYFEEEPEKIDQFELAFDTVDTSKPVKDAFREKHDAFVKNSKDLITRTQPYLDLCSVNQYYPTDIDYVMTLTRNPESFCLLSERGNEGTYKILIKRIRLIVRKIIPASHMIAREAAYFFDKKATAYIPYTHTTMTTRLLPANTVQYTFYTSKRENSTNVMFSHLEVSIKSEIY